MQNYIASLLADVAYLDNHPSAKLMMDGKVTKAGADERGWSESDRVFFNDHFIMTHQAYDVDGYGKGFTGSTIVSIQPIISNVETIMNSGVTSITYRGTFEPSDFVADFKMAINAGLALRESLTAVIGDINLGNLDEKSIDILINKINDFSNNDYSSLIERQRKGALDYFNKVVSENNNVKVNVYGHSLGGYLANYVSVMGDNYQNIINTVTFNAPGFDSNQMLVIDMVKDLDILKSSLNSDSQKIKIQEGIQKIIDMSEKAFNINSFDKLHSIYSTTGPELTTNDKLGMFHPELRIPLYTDDAGMIDNHYVRYLRESLCVYDSLNCLMTGDTLQNYEKITTILTGYVKDLGLDSTFKSINATLKHIATFLGISSNNGIDVLNFVNSLSISEIMSYHVNKTSEKTSSDALSGDGAAILYSLMNYVPFTITGTDKITHEMYNPESYTRDHIESRFDLFNKIMSLKSNQVNTSTIDQFKDYKIFFARDSATDFVYIDTYNNIMYTNDLSLYFNSGEVILKDTLKTIYFKNDKTLIVNTFNNVIYDYYKDDYIALNKGETELYLSNGNDTVMIDVAAGATIKEVTIKDGGVGDLFIFNGGTGDDFIQGTQYNDKIIGGSGNDALFSGDGDDTINGGLGDDMIFGENGDDILIGGNGNDMLMGGSGSNSLSGGDGDDTLNAFNTPTEYHDIRGDTLDGGTGKNTLIGTGYGDRYIYSGGIDTIYEKDKNFGVNYVDKLIFSFNIQSSQVYLYNVLNDLIITINGLDKIFVIDYYNNNYSYLDEIHFINPITGYPIIWDTNYILQNTINIKDGVTSGTVGDDVLLGDDNNNKINGGAGNDTINGGDGNDSINGDDGNDILNGDAGVDTIHGGSGSDTINGGIGADKLYGDEGDDNIIGGSLIVSEVDFIDGGAGNDTINQSQSFTGDIVWGGLGNDTIYGSAGGDSYHYSLGDGYDKIIENNNSTSYTDQLYLHNINPETVKIYRNAPNFNDLIIDINNGQGTITIINYYQNTATLNYLDKITFDNGTQWSSDEIKLQAKNYYGTDNIDTLTLNNGLPNIIHTGYGDDVITNDTADNTINAGNGDDKIYNNGKTALIHGDDGKDTIVLNYKTGSAGNGVVFGDAGDDTISFGSSSSLLTNYTIIGGLDNDKIYMSAGTETIKYSLGDGNDIIYISGSNSNTQRDKLVFENISLDMINNATLRLENRGKDVVFMFDNKNSITLSNYLSSTAYLNNLYSFEFEDGVLTNIQLKNMITQISKADSTNVYYDTVWDDVIRGGSGVDIITIVNSGTDEVFGNDGDDVITGNTANQTIHGGTGIDRINSGNGNDIIYGDDGDDFISSSTEDITGASQNDSMTGGLGNDTIYLFSGSSTLHYKLGDGNDTILLGSNKTNDIDRIIFGEGIDPDKVKLKLLNKKDVLFSFADGGSILINNYFSSRSNLDKIDFFNFSNGTEWTSADILARLSTIEGTNSQDVIYDTVWDDTINAYEGKDYIYSTSGADIINAGGGDDYISLQGTSGGFVDAGSGDDYLYVTSLNNTIKGGSGNDEYWIDGDKTTLIMTATNNGVDYIKTPNLYGILNIRIDANMKDIYLADIKSISNLGTFYWSANNGFKISLGSINGTKNINFIFNDGSTRDIADVANRLYGDENDNRLYAYGPSTIVREIYGNGGNDLLISSADTIYLDGGDGNDRLLSSSYYNITMQGGAGNDTFEVVFGAKINDTSGYDNVNLSLLKGASYNSINLTDIGTDFIVTNKADGMSIVFSKNIEELILSNSSKNPIAKLVGNEINQVIELMAQYESDELADMGASEDTEIVKNYNSIRAQITKDIGTLWAI